ncbi:helix-turn-helix transcriptional regulator [Burkholderia vietnamiensis]|uniref:helix-turn-helix transcriptional regulator n=1 Tax=Burkholderia vietnamiensis TaxID=60552 RepID=UPI0015946465|nr:AlpA family phage regulatory protein [Burkholderia vietnamiensis]
MVKAATFPKPRTPGLKSTAWTLPETGYVREAQLIGHVLPVSATTLWRMVKRGAFPAPVKLSPRVTAWHVDDVRAYLADPAGYLASVEGGAQ